MTCHFRLLRGSFPRPALSCVGASLLLAACATGPAGKQAQTPKGQATLETLNVKSFVSSDENPVPAATVQVPNMALVSNLVSVNGEPIGFVIRDDDNWQVFQGNESPEFTDDPGNISPDSIQRLAAKDPALERIVRLARPGQLFEARTHDYRGREFVLVHREAPPSSLEVDGSSWSALEVSLPKALSELGRWPGSFLIVESGAYYVQFHSNNGLMLTAEAIGNQFLEPDAALDAARVDALVRSGWLAPEDSRGSGSGNFSRDWEQPAPLDDVAGLVVQTLRDVMRAKLPLRMTVQIEG